jgi:hypothetical protein
VEVLGQVEPVTLHLHGRLPLHLIQAPAPHPHQGTDPERRVGEHRLGKGDAGIDVLAVVADGIDQPRSLGFPGTEHAVRHDDLVGEGPGALLLHHRPQAVAVQAAGRLDDPELAAPVGRGPVALEGEVEAGPHGVAVHGGEDRLPVDHVVQDVLQPGRAALRPAQPGQLLPGPELTLPDVGPGAEGAALAGQDADPGVLVLVQPDQRVPQFDDETVGEGVELFRPVQADLRDPALTPVLDQCHVYFSFFNR